MIINIDFTFLQKVSGLLDRILYSIQYPPHIGNLLILGRPKFVMGVFTNKRSIYNEFGSQDGAFFFNHPVEISLHSARLWQWSWFFVDPSFPYPVLCGSDLWNHLCAQRHSCVFRKIFGN